MPPSFDGSLAAERDAARAYAQLAKAENSRVSPTGPPATAGHAEPGETPPPPLPRIGHPALTAQSVALIVQARAMAAGFGRHKSFDVLGEYLEHGDMF